MQFLFQKTKYTLIISLIFALALFLVLAPAFTPVYAVNITDVAYLVPDGSTNTVTDRAPNNTPIVNIAPPSASGVSLNNWSDYNVSSQNQILNNAKGATVDTMLAGQIYGNPNFNPSGVNEAKTIVNQVTGNNRSNINGATEVAGRKANVVIANGNGIDIAGAGYINTSNLSLVTGAVNINGSGAIDSFTLSNVANSNIIIKGVNTPTYANLGLDASTVDYVDIISRSVEVLGDIHAKTELNFKLGNGTYDYVSKTISSDSNLGTTTKPTFALDSSYLGGMYVGRISLTATEAGIGVRTRGDLVSNAADIVFKVNGDIHYEKLDAEANIGLTATSGKITGDKITNAKGNITLNSTDIIKNNSILTAGTGIAINTSTFENSSLLSSLEDILIKATGLVNNSAGNIEAKKNNNHKLW